MSRSLSRSEMWILAIAVAIPSILLVGALLVGPISALSMRL